MLHSLLAVAVIVSAPDTGKHVFFTGDAGLITTKGNTEITSIDAGEKLIVASGAWKFTQVGRVTYARNHDSATAELWRGGLRGERSVIKRVDLYLQAEAERNTFAGIRSRITPSLGVSILVAATMRDTLRSEVGGAYTTEKAVPPGDDRNYAAGRLALIYRHTLAPKASFSQAFEYLPNFKISEDYRLSSETALVAPITAGVAMKASYVVHYEGLPEPGFEKTDRILSTGVQITL